MNFIIDNWYMIVGIIALVVMAIYIVARFLGLPTSKQIEKIKELLLYWVVEAEGMYGSQTGVIKLRYVYDLFTTKFPLVAKIISFETFKVWVDQALDKMRELLESNKVVKRMVEGKNDVVFNVDSGIGNVIFKEEVK